MELEKGRTRRACTVKKMEIKGACAAGKARVRMGKHSMAKKTISKDA